MEKSVYTVETGIEETHWWFVGRRRLLMALLAELGVSRDANILDVGTGTGTNLRMLREAGFANVRATDGSEEAVRLCHEKGYAEVVLADICRLPFSSTSFDAALLTDVIEHVDDDLAALQEVRRVLRPQGRVILTVPAFRMLWGRHDELAHHKRRYTKGEILRLLERAGLTYQRGFYFNYLLFLPILLARKLMNLLNVQVRSENELNAPLVNRLFTTIFRFDVWSAPRLAPPFGVSFAAVAVRA